MTGPRNDCSRLSDQAEGREAAQSSNEPAQLLLLSFHAHNLCSVLFRDSSCYASCVVQRARIAIGSGVCAARWRGRLRGSMPGLLFREEHPPAKQRAYQHDADQVDAQRPPGLCITAGADPVYSRQRKDAQRQHMQSPPPAVADVWAQPGADTDGDPTAKGDAAERHPLRAIMARERND